MGLKEKQGASKSKTGQGENRNLHHLMSIIALHTDFYPIIFIFSLACMDTHRMAHGLDQREF